MLSYERGILEQGVPGYPGKGRDFPVRTEDTDPIPVPCSPPSGAFLPQLQGYFDHEKQRPPRTLL